MMSRLCKFPLQQYQCQLEPSGPKEFDSVNNKTLSFLSKLSLCPRSEQTANPTNCMLLPSALYHYIISDKCNQIHLQKQFSVENYKIYDRSKVYVVSRQKRNFRALAEHHNIYFNEVSPASCRSSYRLGQVKEFVKNNILKLFIV